MPGGAGAEPENGASAPRVSVGSTLRAERERRGLTLDDVAANLRIRRTLIDAIEHGRFKELPGAPYAVGFIRTYAEFLELDREEIIRRFQSEAQGLEDRKELNFPRPLPESRLPGGVLLLMSAIIAAIAYAFWHFQSADQRTQIPRVAAVPERLAPLADPVVPRQPEPEPAAPATTAAAVVPAEPTAAESITATEQAPARAESPAPEQPVASAVATPVTVATPVAAPAPAVAPVVVPAAATPQAAEPAAIPAAPADAAAQPRVFGEASVHRIVIRATGDSWIQVRDTSGTVIFTRVMRPGDSYNVPNRSGLSLYTGSAGALEFVVDGKTAPSVGQLGAVRRDVLLDPERLLAGTAVMDQKRPSSAAEPPRPVASPASGG
ncbi:MAG TPA: RodZ domain-containing protein [Alphaproteobacteria bacterium]|nr:RodZ domain-containing protein [Alphaproteobacteria bacterium]